MCPLTLLAIALVRCRTLKLILYKCLLVIVFLVKVDGMQGSEIDLKKGKNTGSVIVLRKELYGWG
jgi:hypothetical protein